MPFGLEIERPSANVDARHADAQGPLHRHAHTRYAQTTLLGDLALLRTLDDHGIDEHARLIVHVVHQQPPHETQLSRRQTHTGGVMHDLQHAIRRLAQLCVEDRHRRRDLAQHRVAHHPYLP